MLVRPVVVHPVVPVRAPPFESSEIRMMRRSPRAHRVQAKPVPRRDVSVCLSEPGSPLRGKLPHKHREKRFGRGFATFQIPVRPTDTYCVGQNRKDVNQLSMLCFGSDGEEGFLLCLDLL